MKWRGVTGFQECMEEREAARAARGAGSALGLCDWWEVWSLPVCMCMVRVWENGYRGRGGQRQKFRVACRGKVFEEMVLMLSQNSGQQQCCFIPLHAY